MDKPLYVSHRNWEALIMGSLGLALAVAWLIVFSSGWLEISMSGFNLDNLVIALFIFGFAALLLVVGLFLILSWSRSRRIEYYDDFIKVFTTWRGNPREILYSQLELGRIKRASTAGRFSVNFNFAVRGEGKSSCWDVVSSFSLVQKEKTDLYQWLTSKINQY